MAFVIFAVVAIMLVFLLIRASSRRHQRALATEKAQLAEARNSGDHERVREIEATRERRASAARAGFVASNTPGTPQHRARWGK